MKKYILLLTLAVLYLFSYVDVSAQSSGLSFSSNINSFTPVTGGTVWGTNTNDDQSWNAIDLGFTFNYLGTDYTQVSVNTNGFLAFGSTVYSSYTPLSTGSTNNIVSACGMDLQGNVGTGELMTITQGDSPNRVFTVQWLNYRPYYQTGYNFNFQINLYETTGKIEVVYGSFTTIGSYAAQVGLCGATNADFNNRMVTEGSQTWSTSAAGTSNSNTCVISTTTLPDNGLTYDWQNTPQFYQSSTVAQIAGTVLVGVADQSILDIQVVMNGSLTPLSLTQLNLNINGTTLPADISNAKVYYTGVSPVFSNAVQFGSTVANPTVPFTVTGDQLLTGGTNHFWLAYDISPTAVSGNFVDGECTSITVGGTPYTPDITAPDGSRQIKLPLSGVYTVGDGGNYPNLFTAFSDVSMLGLSGNVQFKIITDIVEPAAAYLPQWLETGSGGYTLSITPDASAVTISGAFSDGVIVLNGADRVTIDGRIGGAGNNLTIRNDVTGGMNAGIRLISFGLTLGCNNVTIRNCNIQGSSPTNTGSFGIFAAGTSLSTYSYGPDNDNLTITENNISRCYYGVFAWGNYNGNNDNLLISANVIGSDDPTTYVTLHGIDIQYATSPIISHNTIYNLKTTTMYNNLIGIEIGSYTSGAIIDGNTIHGISQGYAGGYGAWGIDVNTSYNVTGLRISNNVIYDITSINYSNASTYDNPFGIRLVGGTNVQVVYNSVHLYGTQVPTGSAGTLSAALMITSTGVTGLDVRDNVFSNGLVGLAGSKSYAIYSAAPSANFTTINNNDYYGYEAYGVLGYLGSDILTLDAWQTATTQDQNSKAEDPAFTADDNLLPTPSSSLIFGGTAVAEVPADVLGVTRGDPSTIGAYEVVITGNMTYESSTTTQNVVSALFQGDVDKQIIGVNVVTSGINLPLSATSFTMNTTGTTLPADLTNAKLFYTGASSVFTTANQFGSTVANPNGTFTFTGTQVLGPGNNYFWLTYSVSSTATFSDLVDAQCTTLTVAGTPHVPTVTNPDGNRMIRDNLYGTFTVGDGGFYPNLTAAFSDVALLGLKGNLSLELVSDVVEPGPNPPTLNQWAEYGAGNYTLTIRPQTTDRTLSGSFTNGVVVLNGASRVIFDGRIAGDGNHLTIMNTNSLQNNTTAVIRLISLGTNLGCHNVMIRNCNLIGDSTYNGSSFGIYASGVGSINTYTYGADNDSLSIIDNNISREYYGIFVAGTSVDNDYYTYIHGNTLGADDPTQSIGADGIYMMYVQNAEISNNTIKNFAASNYHNLIGVYAGVNFTNSKITGNLIHGLRYTGGGGYAGRGIDLQCSINPANVLVANNSIYDLYGDGWMNFYYAIMGIDIWSGSGYQIYNNSVDLYGAGNFYSATDVCAAMYINSGITNVDIRDNSFVNSVENTLTGPKSYAIYSDALATAYTFIDNNDYYVSGAQAVLAYLTTDKTTLDDWRIATTQDVSSLSLDPLYTAQDNLLPLDSSPLIFAGVPLTDVTTDILGTIRSLAAPTIGAYEVTFTGSLPPPLLVSPANNTIGVPVTPAFQWNSVTGAVTYHIQVSTLTDFSVLAIDVDGLTTTSYTPTLSLSPTTQYHWRVMANAPGLTGNWSFAWNFITSGPLTAPVLVFPANLASGMPTPIPLSWDPAFATTSYALQVSTSSDFGNLIVDQIGLTSTNFVATGLLNSSQYYWRVQGSNATNTSPWSTVWSFTTGAFVTLGDGTATNFSTSYPTPYGNFYTQSREQYLFTADELTAAGATAGDITSIAWNVLSTNGGDGMMNYTIKLKMTTVSELASFDQTDLVQVYTNSNYFPVTGWNTHIFDTPFTWDGTSNVLVDVCFSDGTLNYSYSASVYYTVYPTLVTVFDYDDTTPTMCDPDQILNNNLSYDRPNTMFGLGSTTPPPAAPTLVAPSNGAVNVTVLPTFEWSIVDGADFYNIVVSTNSDFTTSVIDASTNTVTYLPLSNLANSTTYYWKVKGYTAGGQQGFWSGVWSFTTEMLITVPWVVTEDTGNSSSVIVPTSINPTIGGRAFTTGDAIGFFYQMPSGAMACGGYGLWTGSNLDITVWGDNPLTTVKDGFSIGELYTVKVWDGQALVEYTANATYSVGPNNYQIDAFSIMGSLNVIIPTSQSFNLPAGWSMISSHVTPFTPDLNTVFGPLVTNIKIMKNGMGLNYIPAYNINQIGNWNVTDGYLIKLNNPIEFSITGAGAVPENTPITLAATWNLISYLRNTSMPVASALTSLGNTVVIAKNGLGQMYVPGYNINQIGNMNPGEGYYVNVNAAGSLVYPANTTLRAIAGDGEVSPMPSHLIPSNVRTGNDASFLLNINADNGNEVGIYNTNNELIGSGVVHNGVAAITIWGDDATTEAVEGATSGEVLTAKLFDAKSNTFRNISLSNINEVIRNNRLNQLSYSKDALFTAQGNVSSDAALTLSVSNFPNPFADLTTINYTLPGDGSVELGIYNVQGELVSTLFSGNATAGSYNVSFKSENLSSGAYNLVLQLNGSKVSGMMMIVK